MAVWEQTINSYGGLAEFYVWPGSDVSKRGVELLKPRGG